jgi:hypothetical protein
MKHLGRGPRAGVASLVPRPMELPAADMLR